MPTDFEKLASDLLSGRQNPALNGKSDAIRQLADSGDAQKVRRMLGSGDTVKKAMETGDAAALQDIVSKVLSTDEGARLAAELAKMFK